MWCSGLNEATPPWFLLKGEGRTNRIREQVFLLRLDSNTMPCPWCHGSWKRSGPQGLSKKALLPHCCSTLYLISPDWDGNSVPWSPQSLRLLPAFCSPFPAHVRPYPKACSHGPWWSSSHLSLGENKYARAKGIHQLALHVGSQTFLPELPLTSHWPELNIT